MPLKINTVNDMVPDAIAAARADERRKLADMLETEAVSWRKHPYTQIALRGLADRLRTAAEG